MNNQELDMIIGMSSQRLDLIIMMYSQKLDMIFSIKILDMITRIKI
jgi:hypothetical protein